MLDPRTGIIGLTVFALAQTSYATQIDNDVHLIVKFKHQAAQTSLRAQLTKLTHMPLKSFQPMAGGAYTVSYSKEELAKSTAFSGDATQWVLSTLRNNSEIQYALKDRVGHFKPTPEVPVAQKWLELSHDLQWDEFKAPGGVFLESEPGKNDGAWAHTKGHANKPIVVAVLDTGIEENPSLVDNIVKDADGHLLGWNFAANNNDVHDETGSYHGTHVAGTIAAYGSVMQGIGTDLKILPVKIPDSSSMFYESQVINGIYWSVGGDVPGVPRNANPAKVLNMSFGIDESPGKEIEHCDEALQEALAFVRQQGAVVAAAAGNNNRWDHYNAPAACNFVMRVASTGPQGLRAYYSNYGTAIAFAAPGGDKQYGMTGGVLSTVNPGGGYMDSGFQFYQGTSMASPHAAGVAALLYAVTNADISPQKVEQTLYVTTHAFGESKDSTKSCVGKQPCGSGILDANNAVQAAIANYDVLLTPPKLEELANACARKNISPEQFNSQQAVWKVIRKTCDKGLKLQPPKIIMQKNKQLIADYGRMVLALDTSGFKQCHVIGHNGVGCYR